MKRLFILLAAAFVLAANATAQEHLRFCGMEITGDPDVFAQALVAQGFVYDYKVGTSKEENMIFLKGAYEGYQDCSITLMTKNYVFDCIKVEFPQSSDWTGLYAQYEAIQKSLTAQYGTPRDVYENWTSATPTTDEEKWTYLTMNEAYISTIYAVPGGEVDLVLESDPEYTFCYASIYFNNT